MHLTRLVNADCPNFCGFSGIAAIREAGTASSPVILIRASGYQQRYTNKN